MLDVEAQKTFVEITIIVMLTFVRQVITYF